MRKLCLTVMVVLLMAGCGKAAVQSTSTASAPTTTTSATTTTIDLSMQKEQLVINEAGTYTLTGATDKGVLVNAESGTVHLILNGVTITNDSSAGLAITGGDQALITLAKGTENKISDGGTDETCDAAIYSTVPLTFEGEGSLTVNGNNQEGISTESTNLTFNGGTYTVVSVDDGIGADGDGGTITFNGGTFSINAGGDGIDSNGDIVFNNAKIHVVGSSMGGDAGIDSDAGFVIKGGDIVAMGTDMLETPTEASTQYTLALTLDETVAEGSTISLVAEDGTTIVSDSADQNFRTLLISNAQLTKGNTYRLEVNGTAVKADGETDFVITDTITSYGQSTQPQGGPQDMGERKNGEPPMQRK